jgi:inner membrane protein
MDPAPTAVLRSPVVKLAGIAVLTMILVVPLLALSMLRGERSQRAQEVVRSSLPSCARVT